MTTVIGKVTSFIAIAILFVIALFIVLAIVMYVTRKVDWYARDAG